MTIYDYNIIMLQTNIASLKARLSYYLSFVKNGQDVLVLERKHPIAKISAVSREAGDSMITPAKYPFSKLKELKGITPKRKIDVVKLLREDRDRR
ncbi:MAG: hypothetical protein AAB091_02025 [Elusimicrobiota bacterium]